MATLFEQAGHQHAAGSAPQAKTRALDRAIDRALAERRIVGTVVLVAHRGRLVYRRAAGMADREAERPMLEHALFLLASLTKPITSVAAMRLVEQGRLDLDDPVTRWLPDFRPRLASGDAPVITIRQLLTHTAGLNYDFMEPLDGPYRKLGVSSGLDQPELGLAENLRRITAAPLIYQPGTAWGYSMATDVLGAVVGEVTGTALAQAVSDLVTEPLGMDDTAFAVRDAHRLVAHYGDGQPEPVRMSGTQIVPYYGSPVSFTPSRLFDPRAYPSGGAGMAGTAEDFLTLLEVLRLGGAPLLQPETVAEMMRDQVGPQAQTQGPGWGFGLGWAVLADPSLTGTPQSPGTLEWNGAYGHRWFIDPKRELSVVALTNTAFEGMSGAFPIDVRNAVYSMLGEG